MEFNLHEHQHLRWNPMNGTWILISPHRMKRPWTGQLEKTSSKDPDLDPHNPLRPGVTRSSGQKNPDYDSTYVFNNDFPALVEECPSPSPETESELFQMAGAKGICKVMIFSPNSSLTLPLLSKTELNNVLDTWIREFNACASRYDWIQIFENKGAVMGCSNPHPHCQIWASSFIPNEPAIKDQMFLKYYTKNTTPMLLDIAKFELQKKLRIVDENEDWMSIVPYWATWPYEVMILPKSKHFLRIIDIDDKCKESFVDIMKALTTRYDNLFETDFPYSMGFHGAPTGSHYKKNNQHWQFHALFYPPLLRSSKIKKFMVGYELLANAQRDLTPEQAAYDLRNVSWETHFTLLKHE